MSVDTNVKGKNLAPYRRVDHDRARVGPTSSSAKVLGSPWAPCTSSSTTRSQGRWPSHNRCEDVAGIYRNRVTTTGNFRPKKLVGTVELSDGSDGSVHVAHTT